MLDERKTEEILIELHYLPSIPYFTALVQAPTIWIEQHENYSKRSYRNRCHIAAANGLLRFSIPLVKGKNQQTPICAVQIAYNTDWQAQHLQSIQSAYGNAPFYDFYIDDIHQYFTQQIPLLFDWNLGLLKLMIDLLQLNNNFRLSEQYEKLPLDKLDLRNSILPNTIRQKEAQLIKKVTYPQVFQEKHGFIPNLSILDLLFCTGPQASLILENSIIKSSS